MKAEILTIGDEILIGQDASPLTPLRPIRAMTELDEDRFSV